MRHIASLAQFDLSYGLLQYLVQGLRVSEKASRRTFRYSYREIGFF